MLILSAVRSRKQGWGLTQHTGVSKLGATRSFNGLFLFFFFGRKAQVLFFRQTKFNILVLYYMNFSQRHLQITRDWEANNIFPSCKTSQYIILVLREKTYRIWIREIYWAISRCHRQKNMQHDSTAQSNRTIVSGGKEGFTQHAKCTKSEKKLFYKASVCWFLRTVFIRVALSQANHNLSWKIWH